MKNFKNKSFSVAVVEVEQSPLWGPSILDLYIPKKEVKKDKKFILLVFFRIFAALFTNPGNR